MKILRFALVGLMMASFNVMAEETKHEDHKDHKHSNVETMVKEGKSLSRRKKVEMCHDCGKPEVNCDCPEELKAKEAAAKKAAAQN